jgi:hypothetical protein
MPLDRFSLSDVARPFEVRRVDRPSARAKVRGSKNVKCRIGRPIIAVI